MFLHVFKRTKNIFVNAFSPHEEQQKKKWIVKQINPLKLHHTTKYKSKLSKQKSIVLSAERLASDLPHENDKSVSFTLCKYTCFAGHPIVLSIY